MALLIVNLEGLICSLLMYADLFYSTEQFPSSTSDVNSLKGSMVEERTKFGDQIVSLLTSYVI